VQALEGRVGFEPTAPGLKSGILPPNWQLDGIRGRERVSEMVRQYTKRALSTCLESRGSPVGGRSLRTYVVTLDAGWSGRRESNPCYLLRRNDLAAQNKANC